MRNILTEDVAMPEPTPGYRIRIMRKERGWKQEELAGQLSQRGGVEVDHSMISLYESNKVQPKSDTWDALAALFGVSLDWLRCRSEIRNPDQQLAALNFPEDIVAVARKLTDIPSGWRREICSYVDELTEEIRKTRASQIERLRRRAEVEPDFEKRTGVKITN
jgi:transcriptional regulator with XRE-family HTH domain